MEEKFPNLKKEIPVKIQEGYRTPLHLTRNFAQHTIIKPLNVCNKERMLKATKEKD